MALTAAERETVIIMNDDSDTAIITTYQRPMITSLRKNPGATEIKDPKLARYGGAEFRVPAKLVGVRRPYRRAADDGQVAERMASVRAAKGK